MSLLKVLLFVFFLVFFFFLCNWKRIIQFYMSLQNLCFLHIFECINKSYKLSRIVRRTVSVKCLLYGCNYFLLSSVSLDAIFVNVFGYIKP